MASLTEILKETAYNNLTLSQKDALIEAGDFLDSSEMNVMLITGSAGTGKTFLLKLLTDILEKLEVPFQVCTPTGKSAQVLRSKGVKNAGTIHSMIYAQDEIVEEVSMGDFIYFFKLKSNQHSTNTIYLVDESSMISDSFIEDEILRYGSGFLLKDLAYFISPNPSNKRKIIFFGDNNQLPPVNSSFSPALDRTYIQNLPFKLKVKETTIIEIVRQAKNSTIIQNANKIKDNLEKRYFASIKLSFNSEDFNQINSDMITQDFCSKYKTDEKCTVLLAYTNAAVRTYNQSIREKLFDKSQILEQGDRIIVIRNNPKYRLLNGEMGIVKGISPTPERTIVPLKKEKEPQELIFRRVTIEFTNELNEYYSLSPLILENVLISPESTLTKKETRALMADFVNRHKDVKRSSKEFRELLQNDSYVNCLLIKYGYAITCHKAQGGEWPYVYFDFRHKSSFSSDYFRFCYTGITRAKKVLYAINPPHSGLVNDQSDVELEEDETKTTQSNLIITEETIEETLVNLIKEKISHFKSIFEIENKNFRIRIKYNLNRKPNHTDILYKKDGTITSVQSNQLSDSNVIYHELKTLKGIKLHSNYSKDIENPFLVRLLKDIRQRIEPHNIKIKSIEHHHYQERYFFSDTDQSCSIIVYYNNKNRVTSILPHTGSISLIRKIIGLLNE